MSAHRCGWLHKRLAAFAVLGLLIVGLVRQPPTEAADLNKLDCALREMPADTAFFHAWLRNREQVEAVLKSKAWLKLMAQPFVKNALELWKQPGGPGDAFQQWYQQPENKQWVELLLDLVAQEVYFAGGSSWADFTALIQDIYTAINVEQMAVALDPAKFAFTNQEVALALVKVLQRYGERVQVPELIIGFKVSDVQRAQTRLQELATLLELLAMQQEELKGRIKKVKIDGSEFVTLMLDGQMVPWQEIPPFDELEDPERYQNVFQKLRDLRLTISLGLRGQYVLLALGPSTDHLARLHQGQRLITRPELKPLEQFADQRLTMVSYVSKAMNARLRGNQTSLAAYLDLVVQFVARSELKPQQQAKLNKELDQLAKEVAAAMPQAGALLEFRFLSKRGYEGYVYDRSESRSLDGSKPLTILEHVGGAPLVAVASRSKVEPQEWTQFVGWVKTAHRLFEEHVVPQMPADRKEAYQRFMKSAQPLLMRFDETTGKLFLPALADGQMAFVLDAKLTNKQWHTDLPPSTVPLPLLEPALVCGVSDAVKLQEAAGAYRVILNGLLQSVRHLNPDMVELEIPPPQSRRLKNGIVYFYSLPQWGQDERLVPNATVTDKLAVLSVSHEHAERLLTPAPLHVEGGPLADRQRPLASATNVDCAGLVDVLAKWVEYGAGTFRAVGVEHPVHFRAQPRDDGLQQMRAVFDVLKVFRRYSSITYQQAGVTITQREWVIQDLP